MLNIIRDFNIPLSHSCITCVIISIDLNNILIVIMIVITVIAPLVVLFPVFAYDVSLTSRVDTYIYYHCRGKCVYLYGI